MELLVVRHGIAENVSPTGVDADRALTDEGRERVQEVVRGLRRMELSVERVLHSPWRRAAQTAELLAPLARDARGEPLLACDALAAPPGRALLAELRGERLALVGHEPWLSALIAWLALGDPDLSRGLEMRKASVAWLQGEAEPGGMVLRALLPPRALLGPRD